MPIVTAVRPFISQMPGVPSSFCHRMSDLPSSLKSPSPLTCQLGPGLYGHGPFGPAAPTVMAVKPFIRQIPAVPSLFCHRMSDALPVRVPLKSCGLHDAVQRGLDAPLVEAAGIPPEVVPDVKGPRRIVDPFAAESSPREWRIPLGAGWLMTRLGDTPLQLLLVSTATVSPSGRYVPGAIATGVRQRRGTGVR